MKTKNVVLCLLTGLLLVACDVQTPMVAPVVVDLPVSFKSDEAAYRFITGYVKEWNDFGKKIEKMYREGEKWREKDYNSLSQKELKKMIKLDLDYVQTWVVQKMVVEKMLLEMEEVTQRVSQQGGAKIIECQLLIAEYIKQLTETFGQDLELDPEPYVFTQEENEAWEAYVDSIFRVKADSVAVPVEVSPE